MVLFIPVLFNLIAILVFFAGIAYLAFGTLAMWIAITVVLSGWIILHGVHLARLIHWLDDHEKDLQGIGIWGNIFDRILHLRKSSLKRKKALTNALDRFNQIIEIIPNGIIILNNGRIEWLNPLACEHLNLHIEKDLNHILQNIIRLPEFQRFLQKRLENQPLEIKFSLPKGNHFQRIVQMTRLPFDKDSELLITQDITEKEQLDQTQVMFVSNVSHELRTPLTVINGFIETLQDMPDLSLEQRQQFLGLMQKEGQRMLSVLSDLLTLARLERGQSNSAESVDFDLSNTVMQIAEATIHLSRQQHKFSLDIEPNLSFHGIETELYSALSNLTFNAVRYTPEQGRITISLRSVGHNSVEFSVTDTGVGIEAEHIPRLTERFYRVDNARSRQTGGTGLGLAITKFILAKYNTELHIQSEVGKGSCFKTLLVKKNKIA